MIFFIDLGNQSLEEISLKLVNNIQQEKIKLEQQYVEVNLSVRIIEI